MQGIFLTLIRYRVHSKFKKKSPNQKERKEVGEGRERNRSFLGIHNNIHHLFKYVYLI